MPEDDGVSCTLQAKEGLLVNMERDKAFFLLLAESDLALTLSCVLWAMGGGGSEWGETELGDRSLAVTSVPGM